MYYCHNPDFSGEPTGPFVVEQLRLMLKAGTITPAHWIAKDGDARWVKVEEAAFLKQPSGSGLLPSFAVGVVVMSAATIFIAQAFTKPPAQLSPATPYAVAKPTDPNAYDEMMARQRQERALAALAQALSQQGPSESFRRELGGSDYRTGSVTITCPRCGGAGTYSTPSGYTVACPDCGGQGRKQSVITGPNPYR